MKYLLILLCFTALLSCKKDEEEPVTPDYADSFVGTYIGQAYEYDTDNTTVLNSNASRTLTVTKVDKNRIKISPFYNASTLYFGLSNEGNNDVYVNVESPNQKYGITSNNRKSGGNLYLYIKLSGTNKYEYFQGVKQ